MLRPLQTVVETAQFVRDAAAAGRSRADITAIIDGLALDPSQGDEVPGSGGVRKVRVAGRGKGKSGGYRVMTAFMGEHIPVYLLAALSKGDRANFTARQIAAMKALTTSIKLMWKLRKLVR